MRDSVACRIEVEVDRPYGSPRSVCRGVMAVSVVVALQLFGDSAQRVRRLFHHRPVRRSAHIDLDVAPDTAGHIFGHWNPFLDGCALP